MNIRFYIFLVSHEKIREIISWSFRNGLKVSLILFRNVTVKQK